MAVVASSGDRYRPSPGAIGETVIGLHSIINSVVEIDVSKNKLVIFS